MLSIHSNNLFITGSVLYYVESWWCQSPIEKHSGYHWIDVGNILPTVWKCAAFTVLIAAVIPIFTYIYLSCMKKEAL